MLELSRSLRKKLIGIVLLTTLAALIVALIAIIGYDLHLYREAWISDMSTQAELLGQTTAPAIAFDDPKVAKENIELLRLRPHMQAAAIYTARGTLFATYRRAGEQAAFPKSPEADGMRIDGSNMIVYKRIVSDGDMLGTVYLRSDYELYGRILDYLGIALAVIILAMLVALLMSAQLQRIVTGPILTIAGIAREVVQLGDYSRRAKKLSDDEVGVLVDSFNAMLTEIERRTGELEVSNTGLAREVAERSRAEQEILRLNAELEDRVHRRTAQLESANRELEAFSFSVSHDLRAPLRHIDGYAHMLQEDAVGRLNGDMQRYLDTIRDSARRMGALIDELLAFSRLGRQPLERTAIDMNVLVEHMLHEMHGGRPNHSRVQVAALPSVHGDPALLRQVWINLLSNALKYSAKRGDAAEVEVSGEREGDVIRYRVRDNGVGFDMRYVDKLFGVFHRLHSQEEFEGTGVGLAIVQRIVTRHGGRVWADGELGRGATFTFELPAVHDQPTEDIA
jgi:signal transduction histidine kinase